MYKYKVVYFTENMGPISKEIESSGAVETEDFIIFFDGYGEDSYIFKKEDIISYYRL